MTDRETSVLLDELAGRVPVGPPPTARLLRAGRRARRRRTAGATLAVAAGVAVAVGGIVTVVDLAPGGGEPAPVVVAEEPAAGLPATPEAGSAAGSAMSQLPPNPTDSRTGPLADGGAASCVAEYSAAAVAERGFAFDGVVVAIGPSGTERSGSPGTELAGVTFAVQEWFSGGQGPTVTVDLPAPADGSGSSPVGQAPAYGVGSRLLVSGEDRWGAGPMADPIAWMCGFTRYYDEGTAAAWR
ncbi:hypothetical protein [Blastococcus saxobsidens]|uniref:Uncharacterized protein n=1 Tax=Blastococcus saxobsidens (strain DD2) TaxID=1146883 RepID=H6RL52_BLASD|nr:hypothetical protein [Blastococcus saxobsidens]CCG01182.1 protein of unknown function [Blastococcus saxobsidens DD2]